MATVTYGNHKISVEESKWTGNIKVRYDGNEISSQNYMFGRLHSFYVSEDGQNTHYEVSISFPYFTRKVTISRNGITIFSQKKGFVQPPQEKTQPPTTIQKEVILKEIVLVVCPNCTHRNDSSQRTCANCGASI